jgi:hypothetical protein
MFYEISHNITRRFVGSSFSQRFKMSQYHTLFSRIFHRLWSTRTAVNRGVKNSSLGTYPRKRNIYSVIVSIRDFVLPIEWPLDRGMIDSDGLDFFNDSSSEILGQISLLSRGWELMPMSIFSRSRGDAASGKHEMQLRHVLQEKDPTDGGRSRWDK